MILIYDLEEFKWTIKANLIFQHIEFIEMKSGD